MEKNHESLGKQEWSVHVRNVMYEPSKTGKFGEFGRLAWVYDTPGDFYDFDDNGPMGDERHILVEADDGETLLIQGIRAWDTDSGSRRGLSINKVVYVEESRRAGWVVERFAVNLPRITVGEPWLSDFQKFAPLTFSKSAIKRVVEDTGSIHVNDGSRGDTEGPDPFDPLEKEMRQLKFSGLKRIVEGE